MLAVLIMSAALTGPPPVQEPEAPRLWSGDEVTFAVRPAPEFPEQARSSRGEVSLVCTVTARGTFNGCQIESETPSGNGFGRAAIVSMRRGARIEMREDGPVGGDRVRASIRFWNGR